MAKKKTVKTKKKDVSFLGTKMPVNETLETRVKKKIKDTTLEQNIEYATYNQINQVDFIELYERVNKRIDRIVEAIDKSKSVRGL